MTTSFPSPRHRIFQTTTQLLGQLVIAVGLMGLATGSVWAERILLDWSEQLANEAPVSVSESVVISLRKKSNAKIVDAKSDPANPLPDSPLALAVQPSTTGAYTVATLNPFLHQDAPKKGWVEMEMALTQGGTVDIRLITDTSGAKPSPQDEGTQLYALFLRGDNTTLVVSGKDGGGGERFVISPRLMNMEPQKIRIAWDFEGEEPVITLLHNGEPFIKANEPVALKVDPATVYSGISRITMFIHAGYLGKVTVSE